MLALSSHHRPPAIPLPQKTPSSTKKTQEQPLFLPFLSFFQWLLFTERERERERYQRWQRRREGEIITFEQGWAILQSGFVKLINILEGISEQQFSPEEYMTFYETVYNMCKQKPPHDYTEQLYQGYKEIIQGYITSEVLPSLKEKCNEPLLEEFVKRWSNHKVMIRWLSRFFHYLDCYFLPKKMLPPLAETGQGFFHDLVYQEMKDQIRGITISMIDKERRGEEINITLLKNAVDFFVEIGMGSMTCYTDDFEASMLKDTAEYYSQKASNWIVVDSYTDYMLKVDGCLEEEKDRVSRYLHSSTEQKLLEKVKHELLSVHENQLKKMAPSAI